MDVADLDEDPLRQIGLWIDEARAAGEPIPEAMCLATASRDGAPSARMVLLRGLDRGLVFYTDRGSRKGDDLRENARAAGVLHFVRPVHRQVRVAGGVQLTTAEESDAYWRQRPEASRRSAVASLQSTVIGSRAELERRVAAVGDDAAPARPERWGGYRIVPATIEFWEEGAFRLHDRICFSREGGSWRVERLSP